VNTDQSIEQSKIVFPTYEISGESIKEKKGRSSVFTMHFWWARKPLVVSRATILSLLLPAKDFNSKALKNYIGIDKTNKKRAYNFQVKEKYKFLKKLYKTRIGTETPTILDPFSGGGSISYEGLRLGLNVISADYNPVAYNIQKATLEYPKTQGIILYERMKNTIETLISILNERIKQFYPYNDDIIPQAYLYAWNVNCLYCSFNTPIVNNWVLKQKKVKGSRTYDWVYLVPKIQNSKIVYEIVYERCEKPNKLIPGNCIRGNAKCIKCNNIIPNQHIVKDISSKEREDLICIVGGRKEGKGKIYYLPTELDIRTIEDIQTLNNSIIDKYLPRSEMPNRIIASSKYLKQWYRLLNQRQRVFFSNFLDVALDLCKTNQNKYGEEWGKITATYLSLLIGKCVDFNNRGSSWAAKEGVRNSLAFRRPSMAWDHIEVNPFANIGSGTFHSLAKNLLDGIKTAVNDLDGTPGTVEVIFSSIFDLKLNSQVDLVLTDPPYGDDVQYSELSQFFYSWESFLLCEYYDYLPKRIPTDEDLSVNNTDRKIDFVKFGLALAFERINSFIKDKGQFALFFAHGKYDTWAFVIDALREGRFQINATYPVHTESKDNVIALKKASFMTSVIIYSTKRHHNNKHAYIEDLKDEIVQKIRESVPVYLKYGLKESDLSMVALGPALTVLTQYNEIKSISGPINFEKILDLTQKPLFDEILGIHGVADLDGATKFYLYSRISNIKELDHDSLQLLSKSLNFESSILLQNELIEEIEGRNNKIYQINNFKRKIEKNKEKSMIDYIHICMQLYLDNNYTAKQFWERTDQQSLNRETVKSVLNVLKLGFNVGKKLANRIDLEATIANEIIN
jgi:putative DNA methylase